MKKATHAQTRQHNLRLILRLIYEYTPISRAEIARRSKLTPPTVSDLVEELIADGLVSEQGFGPSRGGKRPTLLAFNDTASVMIGLDLSDELFRGALIDLRGRILKQIVLPLEGRIGGAAVELVKMLVRRLVSLSNRPLVGIGVASQGVVDYHQGYVIQAVRLNWRHVPLKQILEDDFGLPVVVANDSDAAALAEFAFCQKSQVRSLVLIKVGDGVSAGILLDGKLQFGDSYGAGEIGHVVVEPEGELCRCGHRGCLETVATRRVLLQQARQIFNQRPDSLIVQRAASADQLTLEDVRFAFQQRDPYITSILERIGGYLGHELAALVCLLNVHHIYIAGHLAAFGDGFVRIIRSKLNEHCLETLANQTLVEICSRPEEITLLGGAAFLLREKLGLV